MNSKETNTTGYNSQKWFVMTTVAALSMVPATSFSKDEDYDTMSIRQTHHFYSTQTIQKTYSGTKKKSFRERYAKMARSESFKKAYENKSVGDIIETE